MELTKEQNSVITVKDKTMLVAASAGSGKTFVVVEKIINSIVKDRKQIDKFLIVTFTNAAASELRERIVKKLQEALEEANKIGDRDLALHISKQINKVWSANISTIHSFCLNVIKDNFYILGIDPNVTTIDATRANIMLTESIQEIIEGEYENGDESFFDVLEILGSEEELISATMKFYEFYSHIIDKNEFKEKVLEVYSMDNVSDLSCTDIGQRIMVDIKSKLKLSSLELEQTVRNLEGYDEFLKHKEILSVLKNNIDKAQSETIFDKFRLAVHDATNIPNMPRYTGSDVEAKDNILNLRKKTVDSLKMTESILYKDTAGIVEELNNMLPCIKWLFCYIQKVKDLYFSKKQKKGVIDFVDYEELAIKALQNEDVVKRYKEKFDTIYVDEYQDTSYAQEKIITTIAEENNCIMVGDVKQSIYGFRNAAFELFGNKYETFSEDITNPDLKEVKVILANNFRSRREVLNFINDIFEKIMTPEFGGARYTEKEMLRYGGLYDETGVEENYLTQINIVSTSNEETVDDAESFTDIQKESIEVANKIKDLINNFKIYDLKKKEYRKCEYKDIVILLQVATGVADKIVETLKSQNIPAYSNNKTSFYETAEIKLVMDFLKVLDNPIQDIPLAGIMYSKIGQFSLDDMVTIRSWDTKGYIYDALLQYDKHKEDVVLTKKIVTFLNLLNKFRIYAKTYSLSRLLLELYNETGIYEELLLDADGRQKMLNMDALIQIAKDFETTQACTIYLFIQYIESIRKKEGAGDSPSLIGENENVVRIMTIHHSKGLEFPVVILMNTARLFKFPDIKDKLLFDTSLGIGINILDKSLNVTYPSIINMAIKANIKYRQKSELLRLLYVALTRAKEKLIIFGTVKNAEKFLEDISLGISDGQVSRTILEQNNSHLKNILVGLFASGSKNYLLNCIKSSSGVKVDEDGENITPLDLLKEKESSLNHAIGNIKEPAQNLNADYAYNNSYNILQKYTATQINNKDNTEDCSLLELSPKVLTPKLTGASFGTCVHKIIEMTDIINAKFDDIVFNTSKVLSGLGAYNLDEKQVAKKIFTMINTLKQNIITKDCKIEKEYDFIIKDKLDNITNEPLAEPSLIQGIIDMYIEQENESVIVDFKTDRVDNAGELIDKYSTQLAIYKRGIELALKKKNVTVYIYSFALEKLIKIPV